MKRSITYLKKTSLIVAAIIYFSFSVNSQTNASSATNKATTPPAHISVWMNEELNKAKRKKLLTKEEFFTNEPAKIAGYITNYVPVSGSKTVSVDATNVLTNESNVIVSEIDPAGKFTCTIPMNYPQKITLSFDREMLTLYLEPGQVLALCFSWNDLKQTGGFRKLKEPTQYIYLKGPLAKLNYELLSFELNDVGYTHYRIERTKNPAQYLAVVDSIMTLNDALVAQALKEKKISPKAIGIQKNESLIKNGFYVIDYAISKNFRGEQVPSDYYNLLSKLPLNDPTAATSIFYSGFINRLEENPVLQKAYRSIGSVNSMSEVYVRFLNKKDSLMKSDFHLPSTFAYEATKTRTLARYIEGMGKNEAYAYFAKLSEGIKNPYLYREGLRILRSRFGNENKFPVDGGIKPPQISDKPLAKWSPRSLPTGKDADIFSQLIAPYKGKYLFIDFWGILCGPCKWGIEEKKNTREKYKDNGVFEFVFITCPQWTPDKVVYEKYVQEQGLKNSVIISNDDFNYMQQLFHFTGVPHYIFVDPNGQILDVNFEMYLGFEEARKWIQSRK